MEKSLAEVSHFIDGRAVVIGVNDGVTASPIVKSGEEDSCLCLFDFFEFLIIVISSFLT